MILTENKYYFLLTENLIVIVFYWIGKVEDWVLDFDGNCFVRIINLNCS